MTMMVVMILYHYCFLRNNAIHYLVHHLAAEWVVSKMDDIGEGLKKNMNDLNPSRWH